MNKNKLTSFDDWRRQGQEKYLSGVKLIFRNYKPYRLGWEHDHCEFCGIKFSFNKEDLHKSYSTFDGYRWICVPCFNDFREEFNWKVYDDTNN